MEYISENSRIWDERARNNDRWSVPVTSDAIQEARNGRIEIVVTPTKCVPRAWLPWPIKGRKVLCLAGGGGQQGPVLAAAGADVTVLDNSKEQLEKDRYVAQREGFEICTVQGNMQDLSAFDNEYFDLIVHPWSNGYVNDVRVVWKESARVLKTGGILISGFGNPVECLFHPAKLEQGMLVVENRIPYADIDHLDDPKIREIAKKDGYLWGHTLEDQLQGQLENGFVMTGMYEDVGGTALDAYIYSSMATRAVKITL